MSHTRQEVMEGLPAERRAKIQARAAELHGEVEGLRALRLLTERLVGPAGLEPATRPL